MSFLKKCLNLIIFEQISARNLSLRDILNVESPSAREGLSHSKCPQEFAVR